MTAFTSCHKRQNTRTDDLGFKKVFGTPSIPAMLTSTQDRTEYLALHYFDNFDVKDTSAIHQPDLGEQGIVNFIDILKHVSPETVDSSICNAFRKASVEPKMYAYFWKTMDMYLNEPNSPLRNEDLYISLCRGISHLPKVDEVISSHAVFDLQQALKNRTGKEATNFRFTEPSGAVKQMKDFKSQYTILFFYEPDCPTCIKTKEFLNKSDYLNSLLDKSIVSLLAFYPEDDKQLWVKYLPECSSKWINGYDPKGYFAEKQPYDLRAFPLFYLLDKNKTVLLKDAPIETILDYLQQNAR